MYLVRNTSIRSQRGMGGREYRCMHMEICTGEVKETCNIYTFFILHHTSSGAQLNISEE